jgi:predicted esterase
VEEHHITVPRTARYHTLGEARTAKALWIVLHGYGYLARYFLRRFEPVVEDLFIVAPEGLSRFYLDEEHTRVGATWMTREDRTHEIADQITYLDQVTKHCLGFAAANVPIGVLGFSQGMATASRWAVTGTTRPGRLILWGGTLPPDIGTATMATRLATCPVDIVHGEKDALVPSSAATQAAARFREAGVPHAVHQHPGGHDLDPVLLERLLRR